MGPCKGKGSLTTSPYDFGPRGFRREIGLSASVVPRGTSWLARLPAQASEQYPNISSAPRAERALSSSFGSRRSSRASAPCTCRCPVHWSVCDPPSLGDMKHDDEGGQGLPGLPGQRANVEYWPQPEQDVRLLAGLDWGLGAPLDGFGSPMKGPDRDLLLNSLLEPSWAQVSPGAGARAARSTRCPKALAIRARRLPTAPPWPAATPAVSSHPQQMQASTSATGTGWTGGLGPGPGSSAPGVAAALHPYGVYLHPLALPIGGSPASSTAPGMSDGPDNFKFEGVRLWCGHWVQRLASSSAAWEGSHC